MAQGISFLENTLDFIFFLFLNILLNIFQVFRAMHITYIYIKFFMKFIIINFLFFSFDLVLFSNCIQAAFQLLFIYYTILPLQFSSKFAACSMGKLRFSGYGIAIALAAIVFPVRNAQS